MNRLATKFAVATAAAAIMFAGAAPAIAAPAPAAPQATAVAESGSSGTGSSLIDLPLGLLKLIMCGPWGSTQPHPNPSCR
ncbi:hypothetical protein [Nocardia sp. XZ_19_385]|uniref:hypothetical protein n=1 Tax=Nocardia sp. XZ_19_385 TaxID=2769488 RepID=UPI00188FA0FD|nr:hypothetical protein [Nocardia sp. XZ_19_385]